MQIKGIRDGTGTVRGVRDMNYDIDPPIGLPNVTTSQKPQGTAMQEKTLNYK